jgi:hypothetical protein
MSNQDEMLDEQDKKMSQLIARCWADGDFKRKFVTDPAATLKAEGINLELPVGMSVKAVENTDKVFHLVIPAKPNDLSDEDLEQAAGGHCRGCGGCRWCVRPYSRYCAA